MAYLLYIYSSITLIFIYIVAVRYYRGPTPFVVLIDSANGNITHTRHTPATRHAPVTSAPFALPLPKGAAGLAPALNGMTGLQNLDLQNDGLGAEGATALEGITWCNVRIDL